MPIMAKLAIESTDALTSMRIAEAAGAAAAGPTARWKGYYMDLDWRGTEARPGAGYGGTQATPLVCYSIAEARTAGVKIPLYGGGGVFNYENAARILMAGSEMVQLGALACAGGTMACKKLINDLNRWMDENGYADMDSLVGDSLKLFQMDADFTKKRQNKLADAYQTADADRAKCIGCGRCEDVCWHQGIEIKDRKAYKTDKCIGCGYCALSCPYRAPKVDRDAGRSVKCDGCTRRVAEGGAPVCVEACPLRALDFGPIDELREKHGDLCQVPPLPEPTTGPNLVIGSCQAIDSDTYNLDEGYLANPLEVE